jgi:prepilin-type N-terminal cleavage/methylation domain-containing protein
MRASKQKQRGFTIVELLIVIVVIGILAAITIVAYNGIQ